MLEVSFIATKTKLRKINPNHTYKKFENIKKKDELKIQVRFKFAIERVNLEFVSVLLKSQRICSYARPGTR